MRKNAHPELVLFEGKPGIGPKDQRCNESPGPPLSERTKQNMTPIFGRKTRQGKEHSDHAPQ